MIEDQEESVADASVNWCRHCGQPNAEVAAGDWLCTACERFQDAMLCPTCNQPARISLMPPDLAPSPHKPVRKQKPKE